MQKQEKSRKPLIIGIIAAVVILAVVLALLLTQCVGGGAGATTDPNATAGSSTEVPTYELYWNADRAEYDGKSEAGMSSRMPEADGYFHVRFILDGEEVVLKVADRKLINAIDVKDLMGLEFDENGIVIGVIDIDDMPLEKLGWQFYVQSAAKTLIKLNSSESMNGMEVLLETDENTGVYDMTGMSGPVGSDCDPINMDRVYAVANLAGEVTHVFIYQRPNYMLTHEAECEHCKKTVTWYEWTKTDSVPVTTGHYQLQNDIQLTGQPAQQEDAKVCLDLNGKRVDGKSGSRCYAMFNAGTELAIMDTSEGQTGVMAAHGKGDQGMVVWVRYGAFYLYGGTLDASDAVTKLSGTAIECGKGKYFYMYGGTIIGGKAEPQKNDKGSWTQGLGGTMSLGGKFVMNGGEIRDGYAESKVTTNAKGELVYNRGYGGNIYASTSAVIELNGGVIKNGRAGNLGGNIYMDGAAELTINGGKIQGGTITGKGKNGGSIYAGAKTKIVLSSGSISGGTCRNCGGNLYTNGIFTMTGGSVYGGTIRDFKTGKVVENSASANIFVVNGRFHMYGGKIDGGVQMIDTSATDNKDTYCYLTTHATIDGGKFNTRSLTLSSGGSGVTVSVGNLRDTARIGVYTTTGYFTLPTLEENKDNFFSEVEGADVLYHDGRLALGKAHCICGKSDLETTSDTHINGCDGEVIVWAPWTSTSSIPTATGNYYLLKDVTTTGQQVVGRGKHVKLDLNGKNITYKVPEGTQDGFRLYRADYGGKLQITDTTDNPGTLKTVMPAIDAPYNGKTVKETIKDEDGNVIERIYFTTEEMQKARKAGNFGMIFWARGGEIIFHNGKIDGSNLTGSKDGMLMTMGDETYTDATTGEKTLYQASITIYNGEIKFGQTTGTANISVNDSGEMAIHGGTFTGTSDNSRGIYVKGVLNMTGGTITGCAAKNNGGNLGVAPTGVMNMSGGTISGGHARKQDNGSAGQGGNVAIYGIMNMSGGKILDGVADSSGTNVQLIRSAESNPATLNMSGGTIAGGIELNNYKGNCKIVLSGKPVIDKSLTSEGVKAPSISLYTGGVTGAVDASGMTGGKVGIRASTYFATGGNDTIKGYFFSEVEGAEVLLEKDGERLFLGGEYCLCGASKHEGAQHLTKACDGELLQWMAWINTTSVPTATGNYFLEKNVTTNAVKTITSDADIKLDLNGKELKVAAARLYRLNPGNVTVTDSSKDLTGTIKVVGLRRDQGIFWVNDGDLVWVRGIMDGTEHILSGEKSGQWIGDRTGGLIAIDSKASFTMYSGALLGGKTESVVADDGTTRRGFAPTLHSAGTTNIYGGEIVGGVADRNTGNINISGGIFTLHDGVIRDGKAQSNGTGANGEGGNVYMSGGTFFMNGGTISGGEGVDFGGNVYVKAGTFAMIDGTITGGKLNPNKTEVGDLGYGGNICVSGTFKMSGGTITGGVANGGVAGTVDGTQYSSGGGLGGNVCIFGTGEFNGGTISGGEAGCGGNVGTNSAGAKLTFNGVRVEGGQASSGGNIAVNVRACTKFEITGSTVITGGTATGNGGNIYMNAWADTTANDKNLIVNITGGTIEKGTATGNGGNIYAVNTTKNGGKIHLNISSGVIKEGSAKNGGAAYVNTGAILNLSGDTKITDNTATERGGNICLNGVGVLNMSGATVEKGTAVLGGNIGQMKDQSVKMNITGGTIADGLAEATNGTGQGGNIWIGNKGTLSINGQVTITGGHAISTAHSGWAPGGSIYTEGGAQATIDGGATISGGGATDGRNLYMTGSATAVELKDCTFTNTVARSANIVVQGGTLTIDGAKIENTVEGSRNIATNDSGTNVGKIIIKSGTITGAKNPVDGSGSNLSGANIWIGANDILTMTGGTVTGGQVKTTGGNICVTGTMTMTGGTIEKGTATGNGGNIQVTGTMTMSGGEVINGSSQDSGGNFLLSGGGTLNVSGGTIKGGYAKNGTYKSNIFVNNANLVASGGAIYGGVNVLGVNSGTSTITVSDKAVIDGTLNETDIEGVTLGTAKTGTYTGTPNMPYVTVTGKLDDAARIYVNNAGFVSFETESGNEKNFISDAGYDSLYHKNRVFFGKEHCLCTMPEGNHTAGCIAAMAELKTKDSTLGDTIFWTPWTSGSSIPTSGYYYLTKNVSGINSPLLASDMGLAIDLNSYTISNNGKTSDNPQRVLSTYNKSNHVLVITDTSSDKLEKQGGIKTDDGTKSSKNQGGIIWLVGTNNKVYMLAGTLDASTHKLISNDGPAVHVGASNTFNMYGGKLIGGQTASGKSGGSAYINENGTFNLYGGEVADGKAIGAGGGNFYVAGTLNVEGGTISGGTADGNGGSIQVSGQGTMTVNGGTITGGYSGNQGGNLAVYGKLTVNGGTITNGKSASAWAGMNIAMIASAADQKHELVINGGEIAGGIYFNNYNGNYNVVTLSGNPVIDKDLATANKPTYSMMLGSNDLTIGQFTEGANILVSGPEGVFSYTAPAGSDKYFQSEVEGMSVWQTEDAKLVLVHGKEASCVCGSNSDNLADHIGECDGKKHNWLPVTELPTTSGYYYLVSDVTDNGHTINSGSNKVDFDVYIDLNGKTVTSKGHRMYSLFDTSGSVKGNVTICDNSANRDGKIVIARDPADQGQIVWMRSSKQNFAMYGGTIDASKGTIVLTKTLSGLVISGSGSTKLFRGTIIGGNAGGTNWGGSAVAFEGVNSTYILGEDMVITQGTGSAIYLSDNVKIDVSKLTKAPETPWAVDASGIFTNGWDKDTMNIEDYFQSASASGAEIWVDETTGELYMGKKYCVCGKTTDHIGDCGGKVLSWRPWRSDKYLPNVADNLYLVRDITTTATHTVSNNMKLDLNGFDITHDIAVTTTRENVRTIKVSDNVTFTLTDCSGTPGTIKAEMFTEEDIAAYITKVNGDTNTSNNIADTEAFTTNAKTVIAKGTSGMLLYTEKGNIVIYNGVVDGTGLTAEADGQTVVVNGGSFTMHNGTLKAGSQKWSGAAISLSGNGTVTINGGTIYGGTSGDKAGAIMVHSGKLNINGGTITGGSAKNGGNIYVKVGTLAMTGGMITGGNSTDNGNNIYVAEGGNVEMTAGKIVSTVNGPESAVRCNIYVDGTSKFVMKGGSIENTATNVRNISLSGEFDMQGGTVTGGSINRNDNGANVGAWGGSTFTMSGGTVQRGYTDNQGANFAVYGTLKVSGSAVIKDGRSAKDQGHNIAMVHTGGAATLEISGGTIAGGIYMNNAYGTATVKLSGKPVIDKAQTSDGVAQPVDSLRISKAYGSDSNTILDVSGLTGGTIYVKGYTTGQFAKNATEGMVSYFVTETVIDGTTLPVCYDNGGLYFGKVYCLCGASETGGTHSQGCLVTNNGEELIWLPADSLSELSKSGNYYLTTDLTNKGHSLPGNANINLDLNGHTIKRTDGNRVFSFYLNENTTIENTTLTITNTVSGQGGITTSGESTNQGSIVWLTGTNNSLNLIQGVYDASGFTLSASKGGRSGAAIEGNSTSTINIYKGVTLKSGTVIQGGTTNEAYGGGISTGGELNVLGGTIQGGKATRGGNIRGTDSSTITLSGSAEVIGGEINSESAGSLYNLGGNIYTGGKLYIKDNAQVTGGKAGMTLAGNWVAGGNIFAGGTLEISGNAKVTGGQSSSQGGNIYCNGSAVIEISDNAEISGGQGANGGNFYLDKGTKFTMSAGTVKNGTATGSGGNFYVVGKSNLTISGGTVEKGIANAYGGNICTSADGSNVPTINLSNITLSGGTATLNRGGNMHITCGTTSLNKVTVTEGTAANGGNISVAGGTVTVTNSTVKDGHADNTTGKGYGQGGNLYTSGGTFTLESGSTISGGHLTNGNGDSWKPGANGYLSGGTVNIKGTVTGGIGASQGHNFYVNAGSKLNVDGGIVKNTTEGAHNIYVKGGKVNVLNDGQVICEANNSHNIYTNAEVGETDKSPEINIASGLVSNEKCTGNSNNLYLSETTKLNLTGGIVRNGQANQNTNVYLAGSKTFGSGDDAYTRHTVVNMTGGTITCVYTDGYTGRNVTMAGNSEFTMSGGTISNARMKNNSGANLSVASGATFVMSGGTISGGIADYTTYTTDGGYGGSIVVSGTFKMSDGTVTGGKLLKTSSGGGLGGNFWVKGTLVVTGGTIEKGEAVSGGNIGTNDKNATIRISGATIQNGIAQAGGNVYLNVRSCKEFTIGEGTKVLSGQATAGNGGNIGINIFQDNGSKPATTMKISGATITGGTATNEGGNLYIGGHSGDVAKVRIENTTISSGSATTTGGVYTGNANTSVTLNGKVVISGNTGTNLWLGNSLTVGVEALTTGSKIGLDAATDRIVSNVVDAAEAAYFTSDDAERTVSQIVDGTDAGKLYFGYYNCICGGTAEYKNNDCAMDGHKKVRWTAWDGDAADITQDGYYYLTATKTGVSTLSLQPAANYLTSVYVNLNGHSLSGWRVFQTRDGSVLGIADHKGGGAVLTTGPSGDHSGVVHVMGQSTLKLYSGIFGVTTSHSNTVKYAAIISTSGTSQVHMYGGTIENGKTLQNGGNIRIGSGTTFNLYAGTIRNGKSNNTAGNIHVDSGTLNVYGGTITGGGKWNGTDATNFSGMDTGNVYVVNGKMNIEGGTIDGDITVVNWGGTSTVTIKGAPKIGVGNVVGIRLSYGSTSTAIPVLNVKGKITSANAIPIAAKAEATLPAAFAQGSGYTLPYEAKGWFTSEQGHQIGLFEDGKLYLVDKDAHMHCECGGLLVDDATHTCVDLIYTEWNGTQAGLKNAENKFSGNYFLAESYSLTDSQYVMTDADLNICLNGKTLTGTKTRTLRFDGASVATITCCAEEKGAIALTRNSESTDQACCLWTRGTSQVRVYNITMKVPTTGAKLNTNSGYAVGIEGGTRMDLYNVTVIGGQTANYGSAIAVNGTGILGLHGTCSITGPEGEDALYVADTAKVDVSGLKSVKETIVVSAAGTFTTGYGANTSADKANFFKIWNDQVPVSLVDGELFAGIINCYCGATDGNHTDGCIKVSGVSSAAEVKSIRWIPWRSATSLPNSGHYYLINNVTKIGGKGFSNSNTAAIDLRGYTISNEGTGVSAAQNRLITFRDRNNATVVFTDTTGKNGKVVATLDEGQVSTSNQGPIWFSESAADKCNSNKLYFLNCEFDASGYSVTHGSIRMDGSKDNLVYMDNAIIRGHKNSSTTDCGGTFYIAGTNNKVELNNTVVYAMTGTNTKGAAVYMAGTGSEFVMTDSTIHGAAVTQNGGAVYMEAGEFTMNGGTINGSTVGTSGGAVYLYNKAKFTMNDGTIEGGKASDKGGSVYVSTDGEFVMNGGTIQNGKATTNGGNISVYSSGKLTINGESAKVINGESVLGGNICANHYNDLAPTLTVMKGTIEGGTGTEGANVAIVGKVNASISGGTIDGGMLVRNVDGKLPNVTVSGDAVIYSGTSTGNLLLDVAGTNKYAITFGTLNENAKIGLGATTNFAAGDVIAKGIQTVQNLVLDKTNWNYTISTASGDIVLEAKSTTP